MIHDQQFIWVVSSDTCFQVSCDFFGVCVFYQGVTDSEKRVLCLSAENESLKHSLTVTQGLLQQLSVIPSQSSSVLIKVILSFNAYTVNLGHQNSCDTSNAGNSVEILFSLKFFV